MNCNNCYFNAINPVEDQGHCYMFKNEPNGDCKQFKFSDEAKRNILNVLEECK